MQPLVTDAPDINANDYVMAKNAAETLHKHYPGHLWAVAIDKDAQTLDVRNLALSGVWGFRIRLVHLFSGTDFDKQVLRAGGELLERYRLARGKANREAIDGLSVDAAGHHLADR